LPSPEFSIAHVAERVRYGGHNNVPEKTIRHRYLPAGIRNFFIHYQELADTWRLYDNAAQGDPRLISCGEGTIVNSTNDAFLWEAIKRQYNG